MNRFTAFLALAAMAAVPVVAQLAPPNSAGVTMGHVHLLVRDVDAQKQFFTTLGGVPVKSGALEFIQFPGILVMFRKGEPTGGTIGSRVNHFGFHVKNLAETLVKIQPLAIKVESISARQAFVTAPDDIRIELLEEPSQSMPIQMHHVHIFVADAEAVRDWYANLFGATPGQRNQFAIATLPGGELTITKNADPQQPTKGRSFDHVGFDVVNLDEFSKKLEAQGLKFDAAIRQIPNVKTRVAFFTDPWGTYIEVTEHLAPGS